MEKMKIEIWSDIACPYCYIGKRKMETALSQFPHRDEIELVWHSYELNPDFPKAALDKSYYQYLAEINHSTIEKEKIELQGLIHLAKSAGLDYHFDKVILTDTSDALRLVKLAKEKKLADEAEEILFKAFFVDGENISDRNTLIRLGVQIGLPEDEIANLLDSDKFLEEIKEDIRHSEDDLNLEYIPFYLLNNKYVVQGSIANEEYLDVLTKAYDDWKHNGISATVNEEDIITGQACSIDGKCS
ncbi:MAG: DsbA family oxidoreductase [Dysgonomonas sp.]